MLKVFSMLLTFLKSLVFDNKEESSISSKNFNARKVIIFMMLVCSFGMNLFLMQRVYLLALNNIECRKVYRTATGMLYPVEAFKQKIGADLPPEE